MLMGRLRAPLFSATLGSVGAQLALLVVALWTAWRPAETVVATPLVLAAILLLLTPWSWHRTTEPRRGLAGALVLMACLLASGLSGWSPASALSSGALIATVAGLVWSASRERPPQWVPTVLALGLAALGAWAVWQSAIGFDEMGRGLADLPEALREAAGARLASGRAFASLVVPGHLAALLATTLPLLVVAAGRRRWKLAAISGLVLALTGIVLSRSMLGAGLGLAAVGALALGRRRRWGAAVGAAMVAALIVVALLRPDLRALEPVTLRVENWRTALWTWEGTPWSGVGLGGYGHASQGVPFKVENRPIHPHCLPLEWMAELGVAGAGLALVAAVALVLLIRRVWPLRPELAAALAVIPLHNLLDFSLSTSGVAVPWAVLAGWTLAEARASGQVPEPSPAGDRGGRWLVVAAAAIGLAGAVLVLTSTEVGRAAAVAQTPAARVEGWLRAQRLAPWRTEPLYRLGEAALDSRDPRLVEAAAAELDRWRWLHPRSATLAVLRSRLELALGQLPDSFASAWEAAHARPREPRFAGMLNALRRRFPDPVVPRTPGG